MLVTFHRALMAPPCSRPAAFDRFVTGHRSRRAPRPSTRLHGRSGPCSPSFSGPNVSGSQPTRMTRPSVPPSVCAILSTFTGSMPCVASDLRRVAAAGLRQLRLDGVERPGRAAAGGGVDEDREVGAVDQGEGEIEPADAEVLDRHAGPAASRRQPRTTSTPNPSSPRNMLPIPATRTVGACARRVHARHSADDGLHFVGARRRTGGPADGAARGPGRDRRRRRRRDEPALVVLFDRLDVAVWPASARSKMSPPAADAAGPGRRVARSTPSTSTRSTAVWSSERVELPLVHGAISRGRRAARASRRAASSCARASAPRCARAAAACARRRAASRPSPRR